jgi:hypothetical protein
MPAEKNSNAKPRRSTTKKIIELASGLIVVLILLVFLLAPVFISSRSGNRVVTDIINNSIQGTVSFADLSMGWLKGISIAGLNFDDDGDEVSVKVEQITARPRYGSILTGNISFAETTLDQPRVRVKLKDESGKKAKPAVGARSSGSKAAYLSLVKDVTINDGNLKLTDSNAKTVEFSDINSKVSLRPPGRRTDFNISLAVAEGESEKSQIRAEGRVTPERQKGGWSLKGTTGDFIVEVNDLALESLSSILKLAQIDIEAAGQITADVNAVITDGNFKELDGSIRGKNLDLSAPGLQGDNLRTSSLTIDIKLSSQQQLVNIEQFQLDSDWLTARVTGTVPTSFDSLAGFLTSDADVGLDASFDVDAAKLLSQMPKTFSIKEQMEITSGKLSGNITAERGELNGRVNLSELAGAIEDKKLVLSEPLTGKLAISTEDKKIQFDEVSLSASFAQMSASGRLEQLKYDGQVDLEKVQSEFGQFVDLGGYEMAGVISEQGTVSVGEDEITGSGSSQVKNLRITSAAGVTAQEKQTDIEFAFALHRKTKVLTFDSIRADASLGRINVDKARIPIGEEAQPPLTLDISGKDIDLGKVKPFAVLFASLPKDIQLAGIAQSEFSIVSDRKNVYNISTDSTQINNLKFKYPGEESFEPNEVSLIFEAEINPEQKTIDIKELELESPQIKIRKGEFERKTDSGKTKLSGQAKLEYDWSAVRTFARPFLPEGLALYGSRTDFISFASEYPLEQADKALANLSANANLGFRQAAYMGLDFGPTDVNIQVDDGLLKVEPFKTTVNEGLFRFAGRVDFSENPPKLKMAEPLQLMENIKINDQTSQRLLTYVNPIFADAVNVTGIADFNCERLVIPLAATAQNETELVGTISMERLSLQASQLLNSIFSVGGGSIGGANIVIRPTRFVLRDGFLRYDDMEMIIGDNPVNFKGVIGLDKSLDMTVTLPYTIEGETARVGRPSGGQRIKVPLRGTIDRPELDVGKLLESQLRQQLENQLRRGLEELFK